MENIILKTNGFTEEEIKQVVGIHINEINRGFLSSLGEKPLEVLYSYISKSKVCILVLALDMLKNSICGFIFGTLNTSSFYKDFFKKRPLDALIYIVPRLFSFSKFKKALEALFYPTKKEFLNTPKPELLVFAVEKEYRGSGLAQELFEKLKERFREKGVKEFKITTGEELIPAQKFYEKMGAKNIGTIEIHKGHRSKIYLYKISC